MHIVKTTDLYTLNEWLVWYVTHTVIKLLPPKNLPEWKYVWFFCFFHCCHLFFPDHYKIKVIKFLPTAGDNQGSQVQSLVTFRKTVSLQGEENVIWKQKGEDPDSQTWWGIRMNLKFHKKKIWLVGLFTRQCLSQNQVPTTYSCVLRPHSAGEQEKVTKLLKR